MSGLPVKAADRVAELVRAYRLPDPAARRLETYLELLAADPRASTTVRAPELAVDVHVADALTGLGIGPLREARAIADLGAGAGVPGVPLAIALPHARTALVDSTGRRCAFLAHVVSTVGVENAVVVCDRAETWDAGRGACDIVTARALDRLPVVLEYAAPLLRAGGTVVVWRGARDVADERAGAVAADELGLELVEVRRVEPFAAARNHHLHVYSKVSETPARFPRRPGMARKRPLGRGGRGAVSRIV